MPIISIDITNEQALRLKAAYEFLYPNDVVDVPFVRQKLIDHLRAQILAAERRIALAAAEQASIPFTPA